MDSLNLLLRGEGYYIQAYADDVAVLFSGRFVGSVFELSQRALKTIEGWCRIHSLGVNPGKTVVVPFTRRKMDGGKELFLGNRSLELAGSVKYLGVTR